MSKKGRKGVSVDELFKDPEFCRRNEERLEEIRQAELEAERIFAPLMRKLARAGFDAPSIYDVAERYVPLPRAAVEILLSYITSFDDDNAKEDIVRQLVAPEQPFDGRPLVDCFESTTNSSLRWAILNTIACARPHSIDEWLRTALRDTWIETTMRALGRDVHGRDFDKYLDRESQRASTSQKNEASTKEPSRYERVFGPVLQRLAEAGFNAYSIEELRHRFAPLPPAAVEILLSSLASLDDRATLLILDTLEKAAESFDGRPLAALYDRTSDDLVRRNVLSTIAVAKPHSIDDWIAALDPQTKKLLRALDF